MLKGVIESWVSIQYNTILDIDFIMLRIVCMFMIFTIN
jgi:hypothetical protein